MKITILENTDAYALVMYGDRVGFAMFAKKRRTSYVVAGREAIGFFEYYRNALVAWGTEGSTYHQLSKDQVLTQVYQVHSHREEHNNLSPGDYVDLLESSQHVASAN